MNTKLTGRRFGKLVVTGRSEKPITAHHNYFLDCICDCGNTTTISNNNVYKAKSCGCINKSNKGYSSLYFQGELPEYGSWTSMMSRCLNPKQPAYKAYGGKGITICKRWLGFENFYKDMGRKPSLKHSLDRIDGTKNYEPSNCRWATSSEQNINRKPRSEWQQLPKL